MNIISKNRFFQIVLPIFIIGMLLSFAFHADKASAEEVKKNKYAILIVGDESKPDILKSEKSLIEEITKCLSEKDAKGSYKYGKIRSSMQVFSYHINHDREKQFCEKKLNIYGEDLLFLGIISLNEALPEKVIYKVDRIVNGRRAASDIFNYGEELLADASQTSAAPAASVKKEEAKVKEETKTKKEETKTVSKAPAASKSEASEAVKKAAASETKTSAAEASSENKSASSYSKAGKSSKTVSYQPPKKYAPVPAGKYLSCQLGAFSSEINALELVNNLKSKGYSAKIQKFERAGGKTFYRVYSGSYSERSEAEEALNSLKNEGFEKAILVTLDK